MRLVDGDWIIWSGEYAMKTALAGRVIAEHVGNRGLNLVIGKRLGTIIGKAV